MDFSVLQGVSFKMLEFSFLVWESHHMDVFPGPRWLAAAVVFLSALRVAGGILITASRMLN